MVAWIVVDQLIMNINKSGINELFLTLLFLARLNGIRWSWWYHSEGLDGPRSCMLFQWGGNCPKTQNQKHQGKWMNTEMLLPAHQSHSNPCLLLQILPHSKWKGNVTVTFF